MRARVRVHRFRLDHELGDGRSPHCDPQHALRAAQLQDMRTRRRLARGLRDVLAAAYAPPRVTDIVPLQRAAIRAAAPSLELLARRLTAPEPISAQGIALAEILLCDGASPLYDANAEASVVDYARRCAQLLEDDDL